VKCSASFTNLSMPLTTPLFPRAANHFSCRCLIASNTPSLKHWLGGSTDGRLDLPTVCTSPATAGSRPRASADPVPQTPATHVPVSSPATPPPPALHPPTRVGDGNRDQSVPSTHKAAAHHAMTRTSVRTMPPWEC
jgi:hypothetical protein